MQPSVTVFARRAELDASGGLARLEHAFNLWTANRFPVQAQGLNLVLGFTLEPTDFGQPLRFGIRIVDPDGAQMVTLDAEPIQFATRHVSYPVTHFQIVPLSVTFPQEGEYEFEVRVNDDLKATVPLYVGVPPKGTTPQR